MKSPLALAFAAGTLALSTAAFAAPPEGALPLSQILESVETSGEVAYVTDVEWNDDSAAWTIDFVDASGAQSAVTIDAVSGQPLS